MNLDTRALIGPTTARKPATDFAPVLIQVPALAARGRAERPRPAGTSRRRRRLRREVRVAATALCCGLPLTWVLLTFAGPRLDGTPTRAADGPMAVAVAGEPPMVTISLEPATPTPTRDVPPVVLEEIVPDPGTEEAAHAGG